MASCSRRRAARLGDAVGAEHDLVHHPVVDGGEELLLGADVVVERALAEVVGDAELRDAGGVIAAPGEDVRRVSMIAWRRDSQFGLRRAVAGRLAPCHATLLGIAAPVVDRNR